MKIIAWIRKWHKLWPYIWPFLLMLLVFITDVDVVVIPTMIRKRLHLPFFNLDLSRLIGNLSRKEVFFISYSISCAQNLYQYWFWGWFGSLIYKLTTQTKTVREGIELVKETEAIFEAEEGIKLIKEVEAILKKRKLQKRVNYFISLFIELYRKANDPDSWYLKILKKWGYLAVFIMAILPVLGSRFAAVIFCRTRNSILGLIILMIGDAIKTFSVVWGFHIYGWWIFMPIIMMITYSILSSFYYRHLNKRPI